MESIDLIIFRIVKRTVNSPMNRNLSSFILQVRTEVLHVEYKGAYIMLNSGSLAFAQLFLKLSIAAVMSVDGH